MPHNRTRLWVGLAIVVVTIPVVGTYYIDTSPKDLPGTPIVASGRWDATNDPNENLHARDAALKHVARNYDAELAKALGRQAEPNAPEGEPIAGSDDDPTFDIDPMDADSDLPSPTGRDVPSAGSSLPSPTTDLAPTPPTSFANSADAPESDAAYGELSDGDVYRLVTNNLSGEDRDKFTQAYSAMTPSQRTDLLDSFRNQIQNGDGR